MGIATNVLGILKLATGASRIGRGGSTVADDLTALESGQSTLNDSLTAEAGKVATLQRQVVPLARAVRVIMSGNGSRGMMIPYNPEIIFNDCDCTIFAEAISVDWESASKQYLIGRQESDDYNGGCIVFYNGNLRAEARNTSSGANVAFGTSTESIDAVEFQALDIALKITLNSDGSGDFHWYVNGLKLGDPVSVSATNLGYFWSGSSNMYVLGRGGISGDQTEGSFVRVYVANRGFSDAEVLAASVYGISHRDIGAPGNRASQVAMGYDFSSGTDSWTLGNGSSLTGGNSIGGETDLLRFITNTSGGVHRTASPANLAIGDRYRFEGVYYVPSSQIALDGIKFQGGLASSADKEYSELLNTTGEVTGFNFEFVAESETLYAVGYDGENYTWTDGGGDNEFYFKGKLTKVGITGLWSAEHAQSDTGQTIDQIHGNHALMSYDGATVDPQPEALRQIRATLTWSGDSTAKYLCGNQAIWPENAEIERITAVVSGTPVDGTLGDSVDADRYCTLAKNTGLIEGSNRLALSQRTNDGTNLELLWKPSAAFTGTIKFTIHYSVGEQ